jgi:hypothetical protein
LSSVNSLPVPVLAAAQLDQCGGLGVLIAKLAGVGGVNPAPQPNPLGQRCCSTASTNAQILTTPNTTRIEQWVQNHRLGAARSSGKHE